ncbi:fimbrial protein [Pseudomonas chlororaphis]|uniref:fimbrial protein n=1 Tax=Pseudomonas chlororaphis TaxID=587753 RepID=UPI0009BF2614|nr:fimbrial protein [Pseudomonas chlororaphis]ORM45638.1 fimbrial protein [Pseudomonas chlororaphis subsp. chlororaphis]WDH00946.1 fimbrial protein [Pseudomonas chlororaphis]WDH19591.1 fimbrial protein [Pseudomonas chlororaphis]WDH68220.1 fimbrial protein [Pseudomonas chlororaphis]
MLRQAGLLALVLGGIMGTSAYAADYCDKTEYGSPNNPSIIASLPTITTLKYAPMGGVMASYDVTVGRRSGGWSWCSKSQWGLTEVVTNLVSRGSPGLYDSGVPGVGIRIGHLSSISWYTPSYPPFAYTGIRDGIILYFFDRVRIDFVRTGIGVGKGDMPSFNYKTSFFIDTSYTNPMRAVYAIEGTGLKTKFEHNAFFTTCHTPKSSTEINMGRPAIEQLKRGSVLEQPFALDVVCEGLNPTVKPPVKVYFEGNSVRDGVLNLNGVGQPGIAKGVAISLSSDKNVALPFSKAKAVALDWQASGPGNERYRFAAKARYVTTGAEIVAGKADATLTYVLEYN